MGLWERRGDRVETYSGGMRRRLEIARGLLHSPRVLFLDEPTIGLDPQSRASIWRYLDQLRQQEDITIFVTTHYMDEAENCDRIAIINDGQIVALDTPDALKAAVGADRVTISTPDDEAAVAALQGRFGIEATVRQGAVVFAVPDGERFVPRLFAELGLPIQSVTRRAPDARRRLHVLHRHHDQRGRPRRAGHAHAPVRDGREGALTWPSTPRRRC